MSQFISINLNDVKSGDEPLPANTYDFLIESAVLKKKDGGAFPYIEIHLRPTAQEAQGFRNPRVFLSLSPAAAWHLKRFATACKLDFKDEGFSDSDFEGKYIRATVTHEQGDNGEVQMRVDTRYQQVK